MVGHFFSWSILLAIYSNIVREWLQSNDSLHETIGWVTPAMLLMLAIILSCQSTNFGQLFPKIFLSSSRIAIIQLLQFAIFLSWSRLSAATVCSPGHYLKSLSVCELCPSGTYSTVATSDICLLAPIGTMPITLPVFWLCYHCCWCYYYLCYCSWWSDLFCRFLYPRGWSHQLLITVCICHLPRSGQLSPQLSRLFESVSFLGILFWLALFWFYFGAWTGFVVTLAGSGLGLRVDGIGTSASFYSPTGIAIDSMAMLYIADTNNNLIRKLTSAGNFFCDQD